MLERNFSYKYLSEEFIQEIHKKYSYLIDWDNLSKNQYLNETIYLKYINFWDWNILCAYQNLSESFIKKIENMNINLNWNILVRNQKISDDYIEHLLFNSNKRIYHNSVILHQTLSESFIRKYYKKFDINLIFSYQSLSDNLLKFITNQYKTNGNINWLSVSLSQNLSEQFILDNLDNLNLKTIATNNIYYDSKYKLLSYETIYAAKPYFNHLYINLVRLRKVQRLFILNAYAPNGIMYHKTKNKFNKLNVIETFQ